MVQGFQKCLGDGVEHDREGKGRGGVKTSEMWDEFGVEDVEKAVRGRVGEGTIGL